MSEINPTEYAAITIIVLFLIKEMFSVLRFKKSNGTQNLPDSLVASIARIDEKLDNHITHFCGDLADTKKEMKEVKDDITSIKIEIVRIAALLRDK
jgi:cell shape-determining protein MreC